MGTGWHRRAGCPGQGAAQERMVLSQHGGGHMSLHAGLLARTWGQGRDPRCHPGMAGNAVSGGAGAAGGSTVCSTEWCCPWSGVLRPPPREMPELPPGQRAALVPSQPPDDAAGLGRRCEGGPARLGGLVAISNQPAEPLGAAQRQSRARDTCSPHDASRCLLQPLPRAWSDAGDALNKTFPIKPFPIPAHWDPAAAG